MKKSAIISCFLLLLIPIFSAASEIGIVSMKQLFQSSSKARAINISLNHQFSSRKADIVKMGSQLQEEVKKYQKNQSILSKAKLSALQKSINQHSLALRQAQSKFQTDLLSAQNKKMAEFLDTVKKAVEKIAHKKGLTLVLPGNIVLYSKDKMDITSEVLSAIS